jgi:hypothetical protein
MPVERDNDAERLARIEMLVEQYRPTLDGARSQTSQRCAASHAALDGFTRKLGKWRTKEESWPSH